MKKSRLLIAMIASVMCMTTACGGSKNPTKDPTPSVSPTVKPTTPTEPTVTPSPSIEEDAIELSETAISLEIGQSKQLVATLKGGLVGETVTWETSDKTIADVDDTGLVTGVSKGDAEIFAHAGNATAKCAVSVKSDDDFIVKEDTTIVVETTFNDTYGGIFQNAIDNLKKKEPKITVEYIKYSGSYAALKDEVVKGIPANNYPDIAVAYPDSVADFINAGAQLNMERFMDNADYGWTATEKADFYAAYLEEGKSYSIPGTYSLPIAKSTEAMYYDKDKIIGLNLASIDPSINEGKAISESYLNNLTWEELFGKFAPALLQYRETLDENAKKAFLDTETYSDWAVVGYDSDDNLFITLAEQYGYGYTSMNPKTGKGSADFNNDGMKELMRTFNNAYVNKYFTTKGIIGTNVNYRSNEDAMLFSIGSTGGVTYQFSATNPKNVGVARIPHAANGNNHVIQQGPSLAFLNHKDQNRAIASWLFYKELTATNICTKWSTTTGYAPIRASVAESAEFLDFSDPDNYDEKTVDRLKAFNAQYVVNVSNSLFSSPVFKGSSTARTEVGGLLTKVVGDASLTDEKLIAAFNEAYNNAIMAM